MREAALDVRAAGAAPPDSAYKTWPEREREREREKEPRGCLDLSNNGGAPPGTMRLSRALDSISLAYNPITKQLHFVSPKPPRPRPQTEPSESEATESVAAAEPESKKSSVSDESDCSPDERLGHRRAPHGGSFSSTVSSLSDGEIKEDPAPEAAAAKKRGLSSFFTRGVFPWKSNGLSNSECKSHLSSESNSLSSLGSTWKLFAGRSNSVGCASTDSLGTDTPASSGASTPLHHRRQGSNASAGEIKQFEDLVASSVALIQHNRPSNLPAKDTAEELRHRAEYQRMVVAARQREVREARERKRLLAKQARHEDDLSAAFKEWNQNIIPFWENLKNSRKTRDLWWCGLPPAVRGKVWQLAIPNHLNLTPQLYRICVDRAKQRLIQAKVRKNGYKIEHKEKNQNNISSSPVNHANDTEDTKHQRLKPDESCKQLNNISNTLVNGYNNDKNNLMKPNNLSQCDPESCNGTEISCNQENDVRLKLSDKLKDSFIHRNFSEQNLNKYSLVEECNLKKNSQSNPDLCEYSNEWSMELIQLDIARTFPNLCIFQPGGPYFDVLHELLAAYVCYRPDVGYIQGMSFLAAILILNMDAPEAFVCFANLLNGPVLRAAFTRDGSTMQILWNVYSHLMEANLPSVYKHFQESSLGPELYLLEWLYSVFAKAMPLDVACRVWDVFLRDGDEFLFRAALGVLHLYQDKLIKLDFITAAQFLTKLPEDLCADALFKSINSINMTLDRLSFQQLVEKYKDNNCTMLSRDSLANIL